MPSRTQRIAQNSFQNVLNELGLIEGKLQKIPKDLLGELAEEVADLARENFQDVYYAGPQEHIDDIEVRARQTDKGNWSVTATGKAVQWIEFGTGVEGEGTYDGNLPFFYNYNEQRAGSPSHPDGEDFWGFKPEGSVADAYNVREVIRMELPWKTDPETGLEYKAEKGEEEPVKTGAYTTTGNPGNNCLYNAFMDVAESVPDRLEEYMSK